MEQLLLPLVILMLLGLMVIGMIRQRKQMKQIEQMQASLRPGDAVVTFNGLHATVAAVSDTTVDLMIAPGVITTWSLRAVHSRVDEPHATPSPSTDTSTLRLDKDAHDDGSTP